MPTASRLTLGLTCGHSIVPYMGPMQGGLYMDIGAYIGGAIHGYRGLYRGAYIGGPIHGYRGLYRGAYIWIFEPIYGDLYMEIVDHI